MMLTRNITVKQLAKYYYINKCNIGCNSKIISCHISTRNVVLKKNEKTSKKSNSKVKVEKTSDKNLKSDSTEPSPFFLVKLLDFPFAKSAEILEKHKQLLTVSRKDIVNTANALKSYNYTGEDIMKKPMVLYVNHLTLINRYKVLTECGCEAISLPTLAKYITVMNKEISLLKNHKLLPFDANVQTNLQNSFTDIKFISKDKITDKMLLKQVRQIVLNCYLKNKLQMTDKDLDKQWNVYSRIKHKSCASIQEMIDVLIKELNFSLERIVKNGYLLYGDPDNVKKMLREITTIGNESFKEIVYRRPKILMSTTESVQQTLRYIKQYNIPEIALIKCIEILTLGPDTIRERLEDLNTVEEFQVLSSNPRILRLVHYQNKARQRLEYLNQLKVKCASLHILSCGSDAFIRFARDGTDRTKGKDLIVYLSGIFNKPEIEVRNVIARHPNWCHIPVVQIKHCIDALLQKKFTLNNIFSNIHILLYPIARIEEKINLLKNPLIYNDLKLDIQFSELNKTQTLTLILYLIELEFHFTGDGIWTEQHTQQVENFNNLIPDFPEEYTKIYKYGVKPNLNKNLQLQQECS